MSRRIVIAFRLEREISRQQHKQAERRFTTNQAKRGSELA